jgi:hypothetical protein
VITAVAAALKEATETSAQTAKEAAGGDRQAQNVLAKAAAASAGRTGSAATHTPGVGTKGARIDVKA